MAMLDARMARARHRRLRPRAGSVTGAMLGWVVCAVVTCAALQARDPAWGGLDGLAHSAVAAGHLLGVGAVAGALAALYLRLGGRGPWSRRLLVAALGAGIGALVLVEDFEGFAGRHAETLPPPLTLALLLASAGAALAVAVELGRLFRGRARPLALLAAAAAILLEPRVLPGLYPGLHFYAVLTAASFLGAALTGAALPRLLGPRPRLALALLGAAGVLAYLVPVSDRVHFLVVRDGDVVAQLAGRLLPRRQDERFAVHADSEWFRSRAALPPIPPTSSPRPARPVVVLLTVDCMRYDVLGGPAPRVALPHLGRLRDEGAFFTSARTPGSSTVYTLSGLFAGKYFSQLEWTGATRDTWPRSDPTVRFPALLSDAGVWTVQAASFDWMQNEYGIARGFEVVDYRALPGPRWKTAEVLADALIARLGEVGSRPAFLYAHFNDAHLPYDRAGTHGTPFERYARELQLVDAAIGRILAAIERHRLGGRAFVIVTSDHGEAFGEHGRTAHAGSLYEQVLHVPLAIRGPGIAPTTIDTDVSVIDLGPTVLDLFGLDTPPHFMGESLVPALARRPFAPTRPIIAQATGMRALLTPAGLKVIRDVRRGTIEAYDLRADPGELTNRVGRGDVREALGQLDTFFRVHRFRRRGYREPFR